MKYGMKTFDIIEQVPFNLSPTGPHKNLVRQITDELGIDVKKGSESITRRSTILMIFLQQ